MCNVFKEKKKAEKYFVMIPTPRYSLTTGLRKENHLYQQKTLLERAYRAERVQLVLRFML